MDREEQPPEFKSIGSVGILDVREKAIRIVYQRGRRRLKTWIPRSTIEGRGEGLEVTQVVPDFSVTKWKARELLAGDTWLGKHRKKKKREPRDRQTRPFDHTTLNAIKKTNTGKSPLWPADQY